MNEFAWASEYSLSAGFEGDVFVCKTALKGFGSRKAAHPRGRDREVIKRRCNDDIATNVGIADTMRIDY